MSRTLALPMASALESVRCLRSRVASKPPTKASHKVSCARYEAAPGMEKLPSGRPMASMSGRSIESRNATMSAPFSMLLSDVRNRFGEEDSATGSNLHQERLRLDLELLRAGRDAVDRDFYLVLPFRPAARLGDVELGRRGPGRRNALRFVLHQLSRVTVGPLHRDVGARAGALRGHGDIDRVLGAEGRRRGDHLFPVIDVLAQLHSGHVECHG